MRCDRKRAVSASVVAGLAVAAAGCGGPSGGGGDYVVGATTDLSGGTSALGTALRDGYNAYFKQVNANGGIGGRRVRLIVLDDGADPTKGVANIKQLTTQNKVSGSLIFLSSVALATVPVLEAAKTPAVIQATTPDLLDPVKPYVFAGDVVIGDEAGPQIAFAKTKLGPGPHRAAIFAGQSPALATFVEGAKREIAAAGWRLAGTQEVELTSSSASAQASSIASKKPDVVLMALVDKLAVSAVETVRQQGFKGPIVNYNGGSALSTLKRLADPDFYVVRSFPYAGSDQPGVAKFVAAAKAAGVDPNQPFVVNGYVQASVLAEGLRKCGYPCPGQKLAKALSDLRGWETGGLTYSAWSYSPKHTGISKVKIQKLGAGGAPVGAADVLPIGA